jgi:hypothetical protein
MKVFISWSGSRSKTLALHLHDWLAAMIHRAEPWMSERDVQAGQRWNEELSGRLKETHFGVLCLTPENLSAPWLLFEAGALAKAVDTARVVPVLLGVPKADLTFPLAQFQAVEADQSGMRSLAAAVNSALGPERLQPTTLDMVFTALWPGLCASLAALPPATPGAGERSHRSDRQLLEQIAEGLQQVQRGFSVGNATQSESTEQGADWESYYIRGVNLANERGTEQTNVDALLAHSSAIALLPQSVTSNVRSRLYAYRAAMLKRLGRLEEAHQDLVLAQRWATEDREVDDAAYNLACVLAMGASPEAAIPVLQTLIGRDPSWARVVISKPQYFGRLNGHPDFISLLGVDGGAA